jgi:hypothetical protein
MSNICQFTLDLIGIIQFVFTYEVFSVYATRSFPTIASLRLHVHNEHIDRKQASCVCQWDGCDGIQRQFWSFVTHLQDRHLCDQNLQAAAMRRQQAALTSSATPPAPPMPPVTIYPNDAAFQAIRRFFVPPPYPELMVHFA